MPTSIIVPSATEVSGIIEDMRSLIADLDDETLNLSVSMATCLVALCESAQKNKVVEKVFVQFLQGMLLKDSDILSHQESQRLSH